jgi:hypothetical protein
MGKREPQTILKTDKRDIASDSGARGNSRPNQAVGAKTGVFLEGDKLRGRGQERSLAASAFARGRKGQICG